MTFLLDMEEYHKGKADIPDEKSEMLYVISNLVYWYPEIKDRLTDAEQAIFNDVFERATKIINNHDNH